MKKIKITLVSYLNTLAFKYGLDNYPNVSDYFDIQLDIPSVCAEKVIQNKVDLGLIPIAGIPQINNAKIISNYCIGALKKVRSVLLVSDLPLKEIDTVLLDYQSKTSINLVQILSKFYWNISPKYIAGSAGYEQLIEGNKAGVIIGDRTFFLRKEYKYSYDLSEEWNKFTGLPSVFACWVANKDIDNQYVEMLNYALQFGINNVQKAIEQYYSINPQLPINLEYYLTENIDYQFDAAKQKAMNLYMEYLKLI